MKLLHINYSMFLTLRRCSFYVDYFGETPYLKNYLIINISYDISAVTNSGEGLGELGALSSASSVR